MASPNLAILRRRYLMSRAAYPVLLPLCEKVPVLGHVANRAFFKFDRLTDKLHPQPLDLPFLQFCGEVELCAMSGLVSFDEDFVQTIGASLRRTRFRWGRDVLPQLLLRRLENWGRGFVLESPNAKAFVADLLELSEGVSARSNVWFFLAHSQDAALVLSEPGALADLVAEIENRRPTGPDRAALGFIALLEFLQDFFELIEAAGNPYLQSALWHQHADLLDQALGLAAEIKDLSELLEEQPEVDTDAVRKAREALWYLRSDAWESALLELVVGNASGPSPYQISEPV